MALDWHDVWSRINALLNVATADDISRTATRLGVRDQQLHETLNRQSRLSTLTVASAIVRMYGIDPSWLLTGTFDAATHRVGLRKDAREIEQVLRRLVSESARAPGVRPTPSESVARA